VEKASSSMGGAKDRNRRKTDPPKERIGGVSQKTAQNAAFSATADLRYDATPKNETEQLTKI